jgi:hypothetical protein
MHGIKPARRFIDQSDGFNANMIAVAKALDFFRRFVPPGIRPNLAHIQLHVYHERIFEGGLDLFLRLAGSLQHLKITIRVDTWYRRSIDDRALRRLELLEEEGEPYVPEKEQLRVDIDRYMGRGQAVQDIVSKAGKDNRNWHIFPIALEASEIPRLLTFLTQEEYELIREWENNGI